MINRIFRNWKTTSIGVIILLTCFVFIWFEKTTLSEVSTWIMGGFAFLFMTDPKKKNENP